MKKVRRTKQITALAPNQYGRVVGGWAVHDGEGAVAAELHLAGGQDGDAWYGTIEAFKLENEAQ